MKQHNALALGILLIGSAPACAFEGADSMGAERDAGTTGGPDAPSTSEAVPSSTRAGTTEADASTLEGGSGESTGESSDTSSSGEATPATTPWLWSLPDAFPEPFVPAENPMTVEGVELGRHLFYDTRLSADGTYACSTCHEQSLAFTDGAGRAEGVTGALHPRGSMSLANVAYAATLAWGNPELLDLETHAAGPLFGVEPVEMGLVDEDDLVARIEDVPRYLELFAAAYPGDSDPISLEHTQAALASFQRSLISGDSPVDRWFFGGEESAVSDAVKRGWDVFNFPGECTYCHFGFNFSDATYFASLPQRPLKFHNTALYNEDGQGAYPEGNEGLFRFTEEAADMGRFKSPTLRNIAVTAPYMHDGSVETLDEVIDHYEVGGREDSPHADFQMKSFSLEPQERADLLAFLDALTDPGFLENPAASDPWARE